MNANNELGILDVQSDNRTAMNQTTWLSVYAIVRGPRYFGDGGQTGHEFKKASILLRLLAFGVVTEDEGKRWSNNNQQHLRVLGSLFGDAAPL